MVKLQNQLFGNNTHIGDARQTEMVDVGMINLGQLVRDHATEKNAMLVGFGTYEGTVIAARKWGKNAKDVCATCSEWELG